MNWHLPGFQGGLAATEHLDRLAREGARFRQFYVHAVCSPTRAAFLTGRYPFRNGMEERSHGNDTAGMLPDERTLAESLQQAGYDTALIGKWHLGNWYQRQLPLQRGFDHHYGLYGALVSYFGKVRGSYYDWHRNGAPVREDGYTTDLLAREFEQWVAARAAERPFFCYLAFNAIHGPDEAPPGLEEKYQRIYEGQGGDLLPRKKALLARKSAMLESLDSAVGRVIAALRQHQRLDNTLLVFFNDNGGRMDNPPFRGGKGDTFEGGVRVPCIFHWPAQVPAGRTVEGLAHVVDLYPTLLSAAGVEVHQELPLDGMDLWPVVRGTQEIRSPRGEVVLSLPGEDVETGPMAIRVGDWKLVGESLFNITQDPAEEHDLAAKHPDIYRRLAARIEQLVAERRTPEVHQRIPARPLLVLGEQENAHPPAWIAPYLEEVRGER
jgi:arylsulfatase A-like enzyme